jgi:hypothetical protein
MVDIPQGYETLLERPLYGHLATTRPDGNAQVNPMWFDWDGELLRFTHTTKRQKYRNVTANPNVAYRSAIPITPTATWRCGVWWRRSCPIPPARSTSISTTDTAAR